MTVVSLYTTWPDEAAAEAAARTLLSEGLVACANLSPIRSLYRWRGAIEEAREIAMILKTARPEEAARRIAALHPYEVPCVVAWPVAREGSDSVYLDWVEAESCGR